MPAFYEPHGHSSYEKHTKRSICPDMEYNFLVELLTRTRGGREKTERQESRMHEHLNVLYSVGGLDRGIILVSGEL